jgi:vitamin B12 transporter
VRYVSRQWDSATTANRVKPFTTVDLHASYQIDPRVSLYTRLENLFDREYQEVRNFNAPGFSVYAGVKATY